STPKRCRCSCARPTWRATRSGCASAARTRRSRSGGGWQTPSGNWPAAANTNMRSSTTTWTRRGASCVRSSGARGREASMLDELKEEGIVNKVGGRFKLSTLIQKRMVALNTGAKPLVEVRGGDKMSIVIQEILQDKIYLDMSGQIQTRDGGPGDAA